MHNVIDILRDRGLIEQTTSDLVRDAVEKSINVYCGFDPTADSLHLGNMVPLMTLAWFQRCGHTPFAIMGGATGMIGDPSGKSCERTLLDRETLQANIAGIRKDLERVLLQRNGPQTPHFLNNLDWFQKFSFVDFLRDIGKHFRIGVMLSKESVRERMKTEDGMSYTEFSYQVLQGFDFYYLFKECNVTLQIGGSDQWGNITAGMDLIKKLTGKSVFGVTVPLLTKSGGQKFGKSEKGALWMNPEKLSSFDLFQQLIRVEDADVIKLLRMLTFVEMDHIRRLEAEMKQEQYMPNKAQKILAQEVVLLLHGEEGLKKALAATAGSQPGKDTELDVETLRSLIGNILTVTLSHENVVSKKLVDTVVTAGFMSSKSEVKRLIKNGGMYLNNKKIVDEEYLITHDDLVGQTFILFAFGKKNKALIELLD